MQAVCLLRSESPKDRLRGGDFTANIRTEIENKSTEQCSIVILDPPTGDRTVYERVTSKPVMVCG